jgi:hypothetical protein
MIDARSNLFSLGALFYEMVTEHKAFDGGDFEALRRCLLENTPAPPAQLNPKLHPLLNDLILKALAKDPDERYQSGRELLEDLEQCKESKPAAKSAAPAKAASPAAAVRPTGLQPAPARAEPSRKTAVAHAAVAQVTVPVLSASSSNPPSASRSQKADIAPPAVLSASGVKEPKVETFTPAPSTGRFAVDPMMAAEAPSSGNKVSFSEMTELPPLKEIYVSPPPPTVPEAQIPHPAADFGTQTSARKDDRKQQTREAAQKALQEIKGVPPSLMVYAVAAAAVVILIIAIGLVLHINHLNRDEDAARPTAALASPYSAQPAPAAQPDAQNSEQTAAPEEIPSETAEPLPGAARSAGARSRSSKRNKNTSPAAPVVLPGQMAIDSTPQGAQFQIDGKTDPSWITPFTLTSLDPGTHTVTVSKAGYASDTRTVEVPSGSKSFVVTHLTQLMATLSVNSTPAGANVYVDGKDTGKLTPAQVSLDKGQHSILVRKQGFLDETTSAQFALSQTVNFSPTLRALGNVDDIRTVNKISKLFGGKDEKGMGTVFVRTQPKGAQVAVNQHMVGKNSPVDFMLDPGNYIVDITLTGYAPIHKVITVDKGGKAVIDEVMTHE